MGKIIASDSELYNDIVEMLSNGNFLQLNGKSINLTELNEYMNAQQQEIERLNKAREIDIEYNKYLQKEIIRLNNIINELEKYINENYIYDEVGMKIFDASTLQDKLQELKGSESNE